MKKLLFIFVNIIIVNSIFAQSNLLYNSIRARQIGPALTSGRITDLEMHPAKQNVIFVGTAGGGVWKSSDAGINFSPVFDDYCQSIGTIAIDPNDPDGTIWVGTGETWTRNSTSVGCGIFKSTDGGKNWKLKGLESSERISSIIVKPGNSDIIYAGVLGALWNDSEERGIYKSIDGGETWDKIFYINKKTGCSDLIIDPSNPDVMYAGFWEFRRKPWEFVSGGYSSGLYKTVNGGKSWQKIHNGFPEGKLGRIAVAIAPTNPKRIYTVVEAEENSGLYRSDNAGSTWQFLNGDFALTVRPFYFSRLVVDPQNEDIVIKAGFQGAISRDGGKTFASLGRVHSDIHDILFNFKNPDIVYVGTDGGVYRSLDKGANFDFVDNIPVAQFYYVSIEDENPFNVYGGLQDNGSWYAPSAVVDGAISSKKWTGVGGGDGFRVFKHKTKQVIYSEMQSGEGIWRYNRKSGDIKIVKPYESEEKLRFNWNTAIALSPSQPDRIYIGSQFLFVSDDLGDNWKRISPDLTTDDKSKQQQESSGGLSKDNSGAENHCTIFSIAESPLDEKIIWVGTDDGNLQLTKTGGKKWKNLVKNIDNLPANTWCYQILPSKYDKATAFVVFDGHTLGDKKPYLYKTTDFGKSWISLVNNDIPVFARSIAEDNENPNLLFLGTEMGLYVSLDGGKSWNRFKNNVPPVPIHSIVQDSISGALVLGTHGRGVIIIDDINILRQLSKDLFQKDVSFLNTGSFVMKERNAFYNGTNDYTEYQGENPDRNAKIAYYLKKRHVFGKMKLEIFNEQGVKINDLVPSKSKGLNLVSWNFRMKPPKIPQGKTWIGAGFSSPRVEAGKYKAVLTKGKSKYEYEFEVKYDPASSYSSEDRKIQYASQMKLYNMLQELAYLVYKIDVLEENYHNLNRDAKEKLKRFFNVLTEMKNNLVVTKGDNYVGTSEPRLREKMGSLYSDIVDYYGKPSNVQLDYLVELNNQFEKAKSKFAKISRKYNNGLKNMKISSVNFISFSEFLED